MLRPEQRAAVRPRASWQSIGRVIAQVSILFAAVESTAIAQPAPASSPPPSEDPPSRDAPQDVDPSPDEPTTADRKGQALIRFNTGMDRFREGAWSAALRELLASRALYPTWSATSLAAVCLQRLQRFDEAIEMLERLLQDFSPVLPAEVTAEARSTVAKLEALVGTLRVEGGEPGASLVIDGRYRGILPLDAPLRVSVGNHVVGAYKDGFEPTEARVDVAGRREAVARLRSRSTGGRLSREPERGARSAVKPR